MKVGMQFVASIAVSVNQTAYGGIVNEFIFKPIAMGCLVISIGEIADSYAL